jgi:hypothetical protein
MEFPLKAQENFYDKYNYIILGGKDNSKEIGNN